MGIPIPKISIDVRAGAGFGFAAAVVGGGIRHVCNLSGDVSSRSAQLNLCAHCLVPNDSQACITISSLDGLAHWQSRLFCCT